MKLIQLNYYDPRQKEHLSDRVLKDGDAVKIYSKALKHDIFIVGDEKKKEALARHLKVTPQLIYLPEELTKIKDYSEEELKKFHQEKK